jgi:orsellinic acid C2-O-methyltransferase
MSDTTTWRPAAGLLDALIPAAHGYAIFQISATLARLGVPDALNDGTKTADELAEQTSTDPDSLFRLLRAAAAIGLLTMPGERKFELSELGSMFRSDSPAGAGAAVAMSSLTPAWQAWGGLVDAVRTGRPAFDCAHGVGVFGYLEHNPELAAVFHRAMASGTQSLNPHLVRHYRFGGTEHIVDIGGGNGTHLAAILGLGEGLRGTVFDTASALRKAPEVLRRAGVAGRCETVIGDFFQAVPPGADVYIMKNVLTDWDDQSCITILRNCRAVMPANGKVVIVATLMPDGLGMESTSDMLAVSIFDISLMVMTSGRERTLAEYERLLTGAGLALGDVTRITSESAAYTMLYHLIEALPAPR